MSETAPFYQSDRDLEVLLDIADASSSALTEVAAFGDMLARDEAGTLLAVSRELARLQARKSESEEYVARVLEDHRAAIEPIEARIAVLDGVVKDVLLSRRKRDPKVKSLSIPGFGEWKSRAVGDGWELREADVLERMPADEKPQFVEERPHLKTSAFREYLDALLKPAKDTIDPSMTPEERAARLTEVAEAIAGPYGVTYRPERISVKGPLD